MSSPDIKRKLPYQEMSYQLNAQFETSAYFIYFCSILVSVVFY